MSEIFDDQVKQLALLALDEANIDAFEAEYKRILEGIYTDMCLVQNSKQAMGGEYKRRGEILKGILTEQIEFVKQLKESSCYLKVVK